MKSFSQTFVNYHGCGNCYLDGTNQIITKGKRCLTPRNNPFWKRPIDTTNKKAKSTRSQLKFKIMATRIYAKKYYKYLRNLQENRSDNAQWSSDYSKDDNYSTDDESKGYISDNESLTSNSEQISSNNELTGKNLIIDEDTISISNIKNNQETPNNKETNDQETLNNKETNNNNLPDAM